MYNKPYRDQKPGGWKAKSYGGGGGFGGGAGGSRFGGDRGPREMHPATCEKCGQRCEVPFKPNGRKPVFCSNCFVRDEGAAPKRFGGDRAERPSYGSSGDGDVKEQLRIINNKLDLIIQSLEE